MNSTFFVLTVINGLLVNEPTRIEAVTSDCQSEFSTLAGINANLLEMHSNERYIAMCMNSKTILIPSDYSVISSRHK